MSNKLIAEFMELPTEVSKAGLLNYYHKEYNSGTWYEEHELSYNVSWDWLMPVLSKILDITFSDDETETSDSEYFYNIRDCVPDINHTYRAIVDFIKKYNKDESK